MQGGINRKGSLDSCSTQDPEPLDSGLYCDFARRSTVQSIDEGNTEPSSQSAANNNNSTEGHQEETGLRKFGLFQKFASLKDELKDGGRSWGRSSSSIMSSNHSQNAGQARPMETEGTGAATIKIKGNKPRGPRRGSHCMMPQGGKMPTSAELMAMKHQQTAPTNSSAGATSAKPRRRGSHFMPEGVKMPTSAELMAQKQQANAGQTPQDMTSPTSTMKVKGNKPSRGSQMMPDAQGQMQNLTVQCASPNGQTASTAASVDRYEYGEGSPAGSNNNGRVARRRGSVVRTLMENKNVDGDAHNKGNERGFNSSVTMEEVDAGQVLPQRRSSQEADESSGPKRAMLKQDHSESVNSDDFGKSIPNNACDSN